MKTTRQLALLAAVVVSGQAFGQTTPGSATIKTPTSPAHPWEFTATVSGYFLSHGTSFVNPVLTADHKWLHLEARFNDENLDTASLWAGYNFTRGDVRAGDKWQLDFTPMIGGAFGRTNGIAVGCNIALSYKKKIVASLGNEFVFDTTSKSGDFYYAWPQFTYSPVEWFHVGAVAQRTAIYHAPLSIQPGFLVGFSHKRWEITTYVFDPGTPTTTGVLELGTSF